MLPRTVTLWVECLFLMGEAPHLIPETTDINQGVVVHVCNLSIQEDPKFKGIHNYV